MSSEPKRIGKSIFDFLLHRLFTIIQIAFFVRYFIAYRRMDIAFFQLLDAGQKFHCTRRAQQMSYHRFRGIDLYILGMFTK